MKDRVYQGLYTDHSASRTFRCEVAFEAVGISIRDLESGGGDTFWPVEEIWTDTVHGSGLCILYRGERPPQVLKIYAKNIHRIVARQYKGRDFVQDHKDYYINFSRVTGLCATLAIIAAIVYFWVLPPVAEYASGYIPQGTEEKLGDYYLDYLTRGACLDSAKTTCVRNFFDSLAWHKNYGYKIVVLQSETVNALALPGGRMIIYSGLLDSLGSREELAALLAHESAHVELKHCTRSLCRALSYAVLLAGLTGDANSVFTVLAHNADMLNSLSYSRKIEEHADMQGLLMLEEAGIAPQAMLDLISRLESLNRPGWLDQYDFISSHPALEKRKEYIQEYLLK